MIGTAKGGSLAIFSARLMMKASSSLALTTSAGTWDSPKSRRAFSRPSPHTNRYRTLPLAFSRSVTVMGFLMPTDLMLPTISVKTLLFPIARIQDIGLVSRN